MENYLKEFLIYIDIERGYSKNTLESYGRSIRRFIDFLKKERIPSLNSVEHIHLVKFLSKLKKKQLEGSSIRLIIQACKSFYKFLVREDLLDWSPFNSIDTPKTWKKLPDILSPEEMEKLIETPDVKSKVGLRDKAILELLYGSGLRVSELCNLRFRHFDLDERSLRVFGKGNKERIVPISKSCLSALFEYWINCRPNIGPEDYAFVTENTSQNRLNRVGIWCSIKKYAKQCDLNHKNIHPHVFRHSIATHLLDNGMDIRVLQDFLGHASIDTTTNYLHLSLSQIKQKFHKYHPKNEAVNNEKDVDYKRE